VKSVDSYQGGNEAKLAIDGNNSTFWHTAWGTNEPRHPHTIVIDMATNYKVTAITYLSRQDGNQNGMVKEYEVYLSTDGQTWGTKVVSGSFKNTTAPQTAKLNTATTARYIKFVAKSEVNGRAWTSASEIGIEALDETTAVNTVQQQNPQTKYIYDLQGHRLDASQVSLPHGIYIAQGRKIVK
jgi:beta-galactosidase